MLALALGFLGAVIVVGAFCGGVFLGCWLCGEDGTPARAVGKPARPGTERGHTLPDMERRNARSHTERRSATAWKRRGTRTFRDGYAVGYDAGYDAGYADGYEAGGAVKRQTRDGAEEQRQEGAEAQGRDAVKAQKREDTDAQGRDAVNAQEGEDADAQRREAVKAQRQEDVDAQKREDVQGREDVEEQAREAARQRRRLLDEQAAFRALQHYSAERAYGLGTTGFRYDGYACRTGLD